MGITLREKVAVVTGSGRGIGRAIALLFAAEGARVVVNDLGISTDGSGPSSASPADEVEEEIKGGGGEAKANYDSVATMSGGQKIIQAALDSFGKVDILVNNAGVFRMTPLQEMAEQEWDTMIQVHLKGHFTCIKAALPHMMRQKSGRIINISSGSALGPAGAGAVHYGTAKAGILGLTRSLAREIGKHGITVNAVMPVARTRMHDMVSQEAQAQMPAQLGLEQTPEDIAPIVAYLASDAAANINGATFAARVKGVFHLMSDPTPISGIFKEQRWTVDELMNIMPRTLAAGLVNPDPPGS
ncbi:SDR family NAD(P)-dependent oxidoreductase [Chloroflexota bacterium]